MGIAENCAEQWRIGDKCYSIVCILRSNCIQSALYGAEAYGL